MILVAPTSFKGTHSARAVAAAMAAAASAVYGGDVVEAPVSDGGPGLIDSLQHARGGELHSVSVHGPLGTNVRARILLQKSTAIIESADACGLHLISEEQRDPLLATSFGVGELLLAAASYASDVVIGLGGSGTVDGGIGAARALGWQLKGDTLVEFSGIRARPAQALPRVTALADVRNPLAGPSGAARVFGPQKGASEGDVEVLDAALARMAQVVRRDLGLDVSDMEGGGAAGGLGAGLRAFAGADVVPGSAWVFERLGLGDLLRRATLVVTGEGSYDAQSSMGKITGFIATRAGELGVPCLVVAGEAGGPLLSLEDIGARVRQGVARLLTH